MSPENQDLGPEITTSEASVIWAQKSRDLLGPPLLNGPSNRFARIKIIKSKRMKNRYIGNLVYMSFCVLCSLLFGHK